MKDKSMQIFAETVVGTLIESERSGNRLHSLPGVTIPSHVCTTSVSSPTTAEFQSSLPTTALA